MHGADEIACLCLQAAADAGVTVEKGGLAEVRHPSVCHMSSLGFVRACLELVWIDARLSVSGPLLRFVCLVFCRCVCRRSLFETGSRHAVLQALPALWERIWLGVLAR